MIVLHRCKQRLWIPKVIRQVMLCLAAQWCCSFHSQWCFAALPQSDVMYSATHARRHITWRSQASRAKRTSHSTKWNTSFSARDGNASKKHPYQYAPKITATFFKKIFFARSAKKRIAEKNSKFSTWRSCPHQCRSPTVNLWKKPR